MPPRKKSKGKARKVKVTQQERVRHSSSSLDDVGDAADGLDLVLSIEDIMLEMRVQIMPSLREDSIESCVTTFSPRIVLLL